MENQDKLYTQYKEAARTQEQKGFDRMEAVWNRVEEKLDHKKERRAAIWWKYTGIAALLLLFITIGFEMMQTDKIVAPQGSPQQNVTVIDTEKVKETFTPTIAAPAEKQEQVVVNDDSEKEKEFRIQGEVVRGDNDSVYFVKNAKFTSTKNIDDTEYYYTAYKAKLVPGRKDTVASAEKQTVITTAPLIFSGTVTDDAGMPIPGVSVHIAGTKQAVQTDFDGRYTIAAKEGDTLKMSFIDMTEKTVVVNAANNNNSIAMTPTEFGNVVVEGYSTTAKQYSNSAVGFTAKPAKATPVTTVTSRTIEGRPKLSVAEMHDTPSYTVTKKGETPNPLNNTGATSGYLNNIDATSAKKIDYATVESDANSYELNSSMDPANTNGKKAVVIVQNNERKKSKVNINDVPDAGIYDVMQPQTWASGLDDKPTNAKPGADSAVVIRGVGSLQTPQEPLYVIDGIPVTADVIKALNANDIESINVLKNAGATALYGSRGANGVIIIKTKNGKGLSKEALKKIKKAEKERLKEKKQIQRDFEDEQRGQRKLTEKAEREQQKAEEAEEKRRLTEKVAVDKEVYEAFEENRFENPATAPLSTFSIDVDNASYTNVRRFLNNGETVPKDAVRVEEMINFFKYSYPQPKGNDPFSINTEYSECPWNSQHKLLKIGLQGKDIPTADLPASNFVFLIDVSGSMEDSNKLPLLKESMKLLVAQMRPKDRIAIVVYSGAAGLVLPSTSGANKQTILDALDDLSAGGSTAGGAGIQLAYNTAQENFIQGGNNRVILATDGDFNIGDSSDKEMQSLIEIKRKSGVFLTCLGYGMGNYKDSKLEVLADKGNGNYAYIDTMDEADRFLNKEFKGSMYAIAKDVKIQIEFNPNHVQAYRLIGYENRKLRDEDFVNDAIDAGELGSGHTVTALYEIIPPGVPNTFAEAPALKYTTVQPSATNYNGELATIKFRYKEPDGDKSTEIVQAISTNAVSLRKASDDFKFAAAVAWFGLKLRDSKYVPNKETKDIKKLATDGAFKDPEGYRAEFIRLAGRVQ